LYNQFTFSKKYNKIITGLKLLNTQKRYDLKIAIASDHAGYDLKKIIVEYLKELGYVPYDFGCNSLDSTDYPIYGEKVGIEVANGNYKLGVLICGTGIGMSICANKIDGIRAVVCSEPYSAIMSKKHNNANILAFGARVVGSEMAKLIVKEWINAEFEEDKHIKRVNMITKIENKQSE